MKPIKIKAENSKNRDKIQRVIDTLGEKGGTIILGAGCHFSGPLTLISNLKIIFEKDARLLFSDDFDLYKPVKTRWEGLECYALQPLILAENCTNIIITGEGIIDGNGKLWWTEYQNIRRGFITKKVESIIQRLLLLNDSVANCSGGGGRETGFLRPPLFQVKNCTDVLIEKLVLRNSPFWNTHILYSKNVDLKKLTFINPNDAPNTDGLDIDSSEYVNIEDCVFDVGDDCLCLKSGSGSDESCLKLPAANINISGCFMKKGHGGIVFGSETSGGINNVTIKDCRMSGTDRGIRFKTRRGRGGSVNDINIENIEMDNVAAPLVINMFYRCGAQTDDLPLLSSLEIMQENGLLKIPKIENIKIRNIKANQIRSSSAFFLGLPESPLKNIFIENYEVTYNSNCKFVDPAMDFFYTNAIGPKVLYRFIDKPYFKNIRINNYSDENSEIINPENKYV